MEMGTCMYMRTQRCWVGSFMTALDMSGFSISIMKLGTDLLGLLDAPTAAASWPRTTGAISRTLDVRPLTHANLPRSCATNGRPMAKCSRDCVDAV